MKKGCNDTAALTVSFYRPLNCNLQVETASERREAIPLEITKQEVNELPLERYSGDLVVVNSEQELQVACESLQGESILGFDTETRPSFKKGQNYPTALLQLCGASRVYLFQLLQIEDLSPVIRILADPAVLKVGVAINDDIRKLQETQAFEPAGFVEISDYTQRMGIVHTGLRNLTAILLGVRISKNAQVSNWARKDLTEAQLIYAATDAWISRRLFTHLEAIGAIDRQSIA